ncbi:MAG TPA: hypothetical protein VLX56_00730 [Nitrososphaerales archaeon]|nr:hypothetical protein [Nitrososphaerales archaeon]
MPENGDEDSASAPLPRIKVRIESLSDLVFGLALSFGSLLLVGRMPQSGSDLVVNVLLFGFGFLIVVMTWLGYSRTVAVLPVEVPFALAANLLLLFCVAIEPYLFYVLESVRTLGAADWSSVVYALDVGGMFFMLGALAQLVVQENRSGVAGSMKLHPAVLARFRLSVKLDVMIGAFFIASALPVFWVDTGFGYLRFYLWFSSFLILFLGRVSRMSKRSPRPPNQ